MHSVKFSAQFRYFSWYFDKYDGSSFQIRDFHHQFAAITFEIGLVVLQITPVKNSSLAILAKSVTPLLRQPFMGSSSSFSLIFLKCRYEAETEPWISVIWNSQKGVIKYLYFSNLFKRRTNKQTYRKTLLIYNSINFILITKILRKSWNFLSRI